MRLLIRVVVFVAVLVVGLIGIGFLLADKIHVERSAKILASPATIYSVVNSFEKFDQWSPWTDIDPNVKVERSGPDSGVGAKYAWHGNADVGAGSQQIIATTPDSEVKIELDFEGFNQPSIATLSIKPEGNGSVVTWAMDSELGNNPIHRYFGLMMDKYIGKDYEKGLDRLKVLAESLPPVSATPEPAPEAAPAAAPEASPTS